MRLNLSVSFQEGHACVQTVMHIGRMFKREGKKEIHGERNRGMSGRSGVRNGYAWGICGVERENGVDKRNG